ncbi:MAG: radical SAM protein [Clostridiales bacterium]|nr:radical SAM protein [Clostridiales bacterium]
MAEIKGRLYARASVAKIPLTGAFELTPLCNFQCKMCYVRKSPQEVRSLGGLKPLEFWLDLAKQAKDAGTMFPLLTGGETFLYPHVRELYQAMVRMGMEVSINSNGSSITEEVVSWLRESPPTRINITLYGGSNESYERLCGDPHGFDKVRRGVELLMENNIRFKFNCSLTPYNCMDLEKMIDYAHSTGRNLRVATYMVPPYRRTGETGDFEARLSAQESAYYQVLADFKQMEPGNFVQLVNNMQHYRELTPEAVAEAEAQPPRPMGCLAGRCSYWVDWQGNLSGCGMMDIPKVSLNDKSLADAWQEIVDWTEDFRYSAACANCVNRGLCFSCAAMVHNETGGFEGRPVYLCEKVKYASRYYKEFLDKLPESVRETGTQTEGIPSENCVLDDDLLP